MLNFLNYHKHPEDKGLMVFYYKKKEISDYMEELLHQNSIEFKRLKQTDRDDIFYLAVSKNDFDNVHIYNTEALNKHKGKFIDDRLFRIIIMTFSATIVLFGILSYFMQDQQ
jgi:hypothetical protein